MRPRPSTNALLSLEGKAAIVTGAGRGIGQAIARRLAEAHAAVLLADKDPELVEAAAGELRKSGARAVALGSDGGVVADAQALVRAAVESFGRVDILVASKGALSMLTRSLALDLAPLGIRVNSICPGAIETPGAAAAMSAMGGGAGLEVIAAAFRARIPLRRMGEPDEIATVALFLASPAASYVTGTTVVADGGYLLG